MEPKITVIVPVYNVEKYLPECLDSLAGQTYKNLQVLVVNDGSTDSSPQIIEDYVRRFPDRFAQLNKPNGGLSDARNFAIGKAEGEWIAFLDSDDVAVCRGGAFCQQRVFDRIQVSVQRVVGIDNRVINVLQDARQLRRFDLLEFDIVRIVCDILHSSGDARAVL